MDRLGKIMIFAAVVMSLVLIVVLIFFLHGSLFGSKAGDQSVPAVTGTQRPVTIAAPEDLLPRHLSIGKAAPPVVFSSSEGMSVSLEENVQSSSNSVWFSFGSEKLVTDYADLAKAYDMTLVLVGDVPVEGSDVLTVSDPENACYELWGLQTLPSDVVLSSEGQVLEYHAGAMNAGEAEGMLKRAREGRDAVGFTFIAGTMSNGNGGFYTNTAVKGASPSGQDVLSESQGLVLWYALEKDDRALFDLTWQFTKSNLLKNGIAAWYVGTDGKAANVNALLDDLRIWYALYQAGQKWDESYAEDASAMLNAIKELCLDKKGRLVDFTDLSNGSRADTIALQYLDLVVLKAMAAEDADFEPVCQNAEDVLLDGRISDELPLYYKNYSYTTRTYDAGNLNTAEALYTLWNLSRAGMLPEDAYDWLKERVLSGTLGARYRTNGDVVFGYNFHSTAVYGLAALIAHETGDDEMFESALRRMERKLVLDADDPEFGAYTQKNAVIYSFDQLIPLLVNTVLEERLDHAGE